MASQAKGQLPNRPCNFSKESTAKKRSQSGIRDNRADVDSDPKPSFVAMAQPVVCSQANTPVLNKIRKACCG